MGTFIPLGKYMHNSMRRGVYACEREKYVKCVRVGRSVVVSTFDPKTNYNYQPALVFHILSWEESGKVKFESVSCLDSFLQLPVSY